MTSRQALIEKCEELLEILRDHEETRKLRLLIADIESLRDRLQAGLNGTEPTPR